MTMLQHFLGNHVEIEVSGAKWLSGLVVDLGPDILVILKDQQYKYVPLVHVHQIKQADPPKKEQPAQPSQTPIDMQTETISCRKMLMNARGMFVEIFVTGNKSIHGYITSTMNNYFVFYSPVYKTLYISLDHLKWLMPYPNNNTPYSLSQSSLPVNPSALPLSRTFEEQCKKLVGSLVVFDLGDNPDKIGLLQNVEDHRLQLVNANGEQTFWNLRHLKTIHAP